MNANLLNVKHTYKGSHSLEEKEVPDFFILTLKSVLSLRQFRGFGGMLLEKIFTTGTLKLTKMNFTQQNSLNFEILWQISSFSGDCFKFPDFSRFFRLLDTLRQESVICFIYDT